MNSIVHYRRGELCSPVFIGVDRQDEMNVIRHNAVFINPDSIIYRIWFLNFVLYDHSNIRQFYS